MATRARILRVQVLAKNLRFQKYARLARLTDICRAVLRGLARLAYIRQAVLRWLARLADTRQAVLHEFGEFGKSGKFGKCRLDRFIHMKYVICA